jgi:endonuclease/exonuclease/phosphatase family metal-dependent hydrolase
MNSTRWTAIQIDSGKLKFNLFAVHFPAKTEWSEISQAMECANFSNDIFRFEEEVNCNDTIVIGDFNMNPFEPGMVSAIGLNARTNKQPIKTNKFGRKVDVRQYKHFYNPMWNFFGDYREPQGTCYYPRSEQVSRPWNIFDQVLLRDGLSKRIDANAVKIVTKIGSNNLLTKNKTLKKKEYSDHLPILLTLDIA